MQAGHCWRRWLRKRWTALILPTLLFAGCNAQTQPTYQNKQGFRFTPPPGWVERARDDAMPAKSSHRLQNVPLPPLALAGQIQERVLVRYDYLAGKHAWLRITVADVPSATSLRACLVNRSPERDWKREGDEESLDMNGLPAARIAFLGRWDQQDYLCETVAVRRGETVYFITASLPASDNMLRDQVRQAVAGASWQ
jgi:hypothetical protein